MAGGWPDRREIMTQAIARFLLALLLSGSAVAQQVPALLVSVRNPLADARPSETVALRLAEIARLLPGAVPERLVVVDVPTGIQLLTQVLGEELLFQADLVPSETRQFRLLQAPGPAIVGSPLVDVQFMLPREDVAWENERIAFRMYGPAMAKEVNNGIDVWTKSVRSLVVEKWYRGEEASGSAKLSYHVDRGEGADYFAVGRTLGAGGSGLWREGRLYQPGVFTTYRIVARGPLRLVFELSYDSLQVGNALYKEKRRITLDAGCNMNRVEVRYDGPVPREEIQFAAGLAKRKGALPLRDERAGWISLWGPTSDETAGGSLGTAVLLPPPSYDGAAEDVAQYLIVGRGRTGEFSTYYAGAGWTGSGDFPTPESWQRALARLEARLRHPVIISLRVHQ
jgi:pectinesterase